MKTIEDGLKEDLAELRIEIQAEAETAIETASN